MKTLIMLIAALCYPLLTYGQNNDDKIEVETTRIKANKEQPKVLYVVPWKEMENSGNIDQKLVLHDFFGDLYDPVLPSDADHSSPTKNVQPSNTK